MSSFCSQCGAALEADARFCEECGAQVGGKVSSSISQQKGNDPRSESSYNPEVERAIINPPLSSGRALFFLRITFPLFLIGGSLLFLFPPVGVILLSAAVLVGAWGVLRSPREPSPLLNVIMGIVYTLLGLSLYLWVSKHSPHMGFGEALMKSGDYYIKEPLYSVFVLFAAGLGLVGIVVLVLGLAAQAKGQ